MTKVSNEEQSNNANVLLPAVFSSDEMVSFGNFIRDNYYGVGAPKLQSYNSVKYPHATIDEIFVIWCCVNGR